MKMTTIKDLAPFILVWIAIIILMMEVVHTFETWFYYNETIRRYIA
jgi:hypothetical protein